MKCFVCGVDIQEEDAFFEDQDGNPFCDNCSCEMLSYPAAYSLISRFSNQSKFRWALVIVLTVVFSSLAVILPEWWNLLYAMIGALYATILILMMVAWAKSKGC